MKYTSQRGTRDILPEESYKWQALETACRRLFSLYNYQEIRTPIFEASELFVRSIGEATDIVSKEMYTFQDKSGRSLTLRPEATAPVVRAGLQHHLISKDKLTKLYYIGPMFRYERPQAGRYRQFYQAGVEAFGSNDPALDAEIILLAEQIMNRLGIKDLEVNVNSVGCEGCRKTYSTKLKTYFSTYASQMCEDCCVRIETNTLRVLDCKNKQCQEFIDKAPTLLDELCAPCKDQFDKVLSWLQLYGLKYVINRRMVRGLDYYTGTIFEIISKKLGAQNAVCGGGRYDKLVREFGGDDVPAVGFAFGLDRIVEILNAETRNLEPATKKLIYLCTIGEEAEKIGAELIYKIRKLGFPAEMDYLKKNLKSQLKEASRIKAKFALILGEDEIKFNNIILRDMEQAMQEVIPMANILERIDTI